MKRFEDYKEEVILTYKKRRDEGALPYNLRNLTIANMRKECLAVFHRRYSKKDEETFKSLLNVERDSAQEYYKKLNESKADIFKALYNFLKEYSGDTKDKNIELLAWLIDFQPRPHVKPDTYELVKTEWELSVIKGKVSGKKEIEEDQIVDAYEITKAEFSESAPVRPINSLLGDIPSDNSPLDENPKSGNGKFGFPRKFNKAVISFVAAFLIMGGSYFFYDMNNQCMYWNGDEYQSINCNQKVEGANIIPKDTFRLKHLKRIKNVAEITRDDIGKVHYSKVNGNVVFYTTGGENPTDSRKRLLPLSEHMYAEHVEGNQP
ncbi:hypothetical protein HDF26_002236 [Pedobacter cryoconitis]|uniref:Uncharacterized protein n=1 Tax=Pedobacter cryoconitis TaxID=188932 RepID=A0A7W8ZJ96_9SPHI|nr:hypothetical protein [Pedobacter cryoconitis]MBB5635037.1 hypothetical protein [Pedobacter cryoconitis]MBB6271779.1 hypothetical protein [Pedobacter cryoconitis]